MHQIHPVLPGSSQAIYLVKDILQTMQSKVVDLFNCWVIRLHTDQHLDVPNPPLMLLQLLCQLRVYAPLLAYLRSARDSNFRRF